MLQSSSGEHETGLTQCKIGSHRFEVSLTLLDLDREMGDIIVDLPVPRDFSCQTPVIGVSHSSLKDVEVAAGSGEHVSEPCG
jgi:hypothetical protein